MEIKTTNHKIMTINCTKLNYYKFKFIIKY